jgi:uncharacterized membrane protein HdeD (DUF308 family)
MATDTWAGRRQQLHAKWGWFVGFGVVLVVLGLYALAYLVLATIATIVLYAALLIVGGIGQVLHAFRVRSGGMMAFWAVSGLLYALAGVIALFNPLMASLVLTLMLGIILIVVGVLRLITAFDSRGGRHSGWIAIGGIITVILGLLITFQWPSSGLWVIGLFLGIDLLYQGIAWIAFGLGVRRAA